MKIQESKEKLPITFITNFIETGWNIIGNLKADKDAISSSYSKTKEVNEIIQDVIDAYTVAVSRMTGVVQDKDYLDYEINDLTEQVEKAKSKALSEGYLNEDVNINIDNVNVNVDSNKETEDDFNFEDDDWCVDFSADDDPVATDDLICDFGAPVLEIEPEPTMVQKILQNRREATTPDMTAVPQPTAAIVPDNDDFICEFEDVDISDRPMTDDEIDKELKKYATK